MQNAPLVRLPSLPAAVSLPEATLFGFDDRAFPFTHAVQTHLSTGQRPQIVVRPGPEGSHDEVVLYYGTVIRIGDTLHLWYIGNYGPLQNTIGYEREYCCICYATSTDGVEWVKPDLGLVEFNGSKHNNIVQIDAPKLWSTCAVLYEPDEPCHCFYESLVGQASAACVACSGDATCGGGTCRHGFCEKH